MVAIVKANTLGVLISFFHYAKPRYFLETLIKNVESCTTTESLLNRALKLLGHRPAMALNCPCLNLKENLDPYEVADEEADCFRADGALDFVLDVAVSPWVDEGELMDAAIWLAQITTFRMYSSIQWKLLYKKESLIHCSFNTLGSCSDTQPLTSVGCNVLAQQSAAPIMIEGCQTVSKKVENNLGHSVSNESLNEVQLDNKTETSLKQPLPSVNCNMHSQQSAAPMMVEGCQKKSKKDENNLRHSVTNESLNEVQLDNKTETSHMQSLPSDGCNVHSQQSAAPIMVEGCQTFSNKVENNSRDSSGLVSKESLYEVQKPSLYNTLNSLASVPFHLVAEYMHTVFRGFRILSRPIVSDQSVENHVLPNLSQTSCGMSGAVVPYTQSPSNRQRLKRKLDPSMAASGPQLKLFKTMPVSVFDSCMLRYISGLEAYLSDAEVKLEVQNLLSKTAQCASTRGLMDLLQYNSHFGTSRSHCTVIDESIHYKIIDTLSHYLTDTSQFKTRAPEKCLTILRDNDDYAKKLHFESVKLDSDLRFQQSTNPKSEFDHAIGRNSIDGNDLTASIGDDLISASSIFHCTDIVESGMAEVLNEFIDTISRFLIDTSQFKAQGPENSITILRDDNAANSCLTPDDDSEIFFHEVSSETVKLDSSLRFQQYRPKKKQKGDSDDLISVKSNTLGSMDISFQETLVNKSKSHSDASTSSQNQQSEDLVSFSGSKTLHIKFPKDFKLPSEEELVKKFSSFGKVDRLSTKAYIFVGSAKVVF